MNLLFQHGIVARDAGGLLVAAEESLTQCVPIFAGSIGTTGEPGGRMSGIGRFNAFNPIERDLLPERDVLEFVVDGARGSWNRLVRQGCVETFKDDRRGRSGAVADENLFKLAHIPASNRLTDMALERDYPTRVAELFLPGSGCPWVGWSVFVKITMVEVGWSGQVSGIRRARTASIRNKGCNNPVDGGVASRGWGVVQRIEHRQRVHCSG